MNLSWKNVFSKNFHFSKKKQPETLYIQTFVKHLRYKTQIIKELQADMIVL